MPTEPTRPELLFHANRFFAVSLLFDYHDLWLGAYWRRGMEGGFRTVTIYLCLIPCLPARISVSWKYKPAWEIHP